MLSIVKLIGSWIIIRQKSNLTSASQLHDSARAGTSSRDGGTAHMTDGGPCLATGCVLLLIDSKAEPDIIATGGFTGDGGIWIQIASSHGFWLELNVS